jgi:DNA-binding response OmpR family regulator
MRVLVVDPDRSVLKAWSEAGRKTGFTVASLDRGREAAAIADAFQAEGIVLNLDVEDVDGRDVLSALHRSGATLGVPVFVMATRVDEFTRRTCLDLGAWDVVEKPVEPDGVFRRLAHWTGHLV